MKNRVFFLWGSYKKMAKDDIQARQISRVTLLVVVCFFLSGLTGLCGPGPIHTDNRPRLEFAAPKQMYVFDPAEAVRLVERAVELTDYENLDVLDILSVAYAAAGRFKDAVQTTEKGLNLAQSNGRESEAEQVREHLELFKAGQKYHDNLALEIDK